MRDLRYSKNRLKISWKTPWRHLGSSQSIILKINHFYLSDYTRWRSACVQQKYCVNETFKLGFKLSRKSKPAEATN